MDAASFWEHQFDEAIRQRDAAVAEAAIEHAAANVEATYRANAEVERDAALARVAALREALAGIERRLNQGSRAISPAYAPWVVSIGDDARAALAADEAAGPRP